MESSRSYMQLQQLNTSTQELRDNIRTRKRKHNAEEEILEVEGSLNYTPKRKRKRPTKNKAPEQQKNEGSEPNVRALETPITVEAKDAQVIITKDGKIKVREGEKIDSKTNEAQAEGGPNETSEKGKKKKRRDHSTEVSEVSKVESTSEGNKSKMHSSTNKKKLNSKDNLQNVNPTYETQDKRKEKSNIDNLADVPSAGEDGSPPTSKDEDTTLLDPYDDPNISESAHKALLYVYSWVTNNAERKFNKARQNWIIRHLWDDQAIPERYFGLCIGYLKGIQGNTRDVLKMSAQSLIDNLGSEQEIMTSSRNNDAASKEKKTVTFSNIPGDEVIKAKTNRAHKVLSCLEGQI